MRLRVPAFVIGAALTCACSAELYRLTPLGILPAGDYSFANGINSSCQIVRYSYEWLPGGPIVRRAFLWSAGVMQDLGTLGGWESMACGINDSDQIVGW